jgi:hypothetical protein
MKKETLTFGGIMKKAFIPLLLCVAFNANASYMEKETNELKCQSIEGSYDKLELTIQKESVLGYDGYAQSNSAKAHLKFEGKILGSKFDIDEKFIINIPGKGSDGLRFNINHDRTLDVSGNGLKISTQHLSDLTNDPTMPGFSTKIQSSESIDGLNNPTIHLVTDENAVGIVRLSANGTNPTPISVHCKSTRDFEEPDLPYALIEPIK